MNPMLQDNENREGLREDRAGKKTEPDVGRFAQQGGRKNWWSGVFLTQSSQSAQRRRGRRSARAEWFAKQGTELAASALSGDALKRAPTFRE